MSNVMAMPGGGTPIPAQSDVDVLCGSAIYLVEIFERGWIGKQNFAFAGQSIIAQMIDTKNLLERQGKEEDADYVWLEEARGVLERKISKAIQDEKRFDEAVRHYVSAAESPGAMLHQTVRVCATPQNNKPPTRTEIADGLVELFLTGKMPKDEFLAEAEKFKDELLNALAYTPETSGAYAKISRSLVGLVRTMKRAEHD